MYDNAKLGATSTGMNAAQVRRGELAEIAERIAMVGKRAAEMRNHASAIADRVFGSLPENEGEMPVALRGDSDTASIHGAIDNLETMISGLDREVSRLSRL